MGWATEEWGVGRLHDGWGIYKGCGAEGKGYTKWEGIKKSGEGYTKWEGIKKVGRDRKKGMGGSRVGYIEGVVEAIMDLLEGIQLCFCSHIEFNI